MNLLHAVRWEGSQRHFFMYAIVYIGYVVMLLTGPRNDLISFIYPFSVGILLMLWSREKVLIKEIDDYVEKEVAERFSKWHMENRTGK